MKIIPPIEITEQRLVATNAPPSSEPEYDPGATYAKKDRVQVAATRRIYEAAGAVTGKYPPDHLVGVDGAPAPWFEVGSINPWAMFDGRLGRATAGDAAWPQGDGQGIQVEIQPGYVVNALVLFEVVAASVTVEVIDPIEGVVYQRTQGMVSTAGINNWYAYLFTPPQRRNDALFLDLPNYGTATIRVSLQAPSGGPAKCGLMLMGRQQTLGLTRWGIAAGLRDYSRVVTDDFGNTALSRGEVARRATMEVLVEKHETNGLFRTLMEHRSRPLVWIGAEDDEPTLIYGVYIDHDILYPHPAFNLLSIDIRGLI